MAKKQQSFFEKLMEKNAAQQKQKELSQATLQSTKSKKKKRSWQIILASSILGAVVATAITVPLTVNSAYTKINPGLKPDASMLSFGIGNKKKKYTLEELEAIAKKNNYQINSKLISNVAKEAQKFLYEQEQKASVEYQRLWNHSLKYGEKPNENIALKSIEEITKTNLNLLKDVEAGFKQKYGKNWSTLFSEHLAKNFDGAISIEEAAEKETYKKISQDSLRRFQIVSEDKTEEIERVANSNIYKIVDGKETNEILVPKGKKVFTWYISEEDEANGKGKANYFSIDGNAKKTTFMTKSFVPEWKDATFFLDEYFKVKRPYISNVFTLPGTAPFKEKDEWNIDRKKLKFLMTYWIMNKKPDIPGAKTTYEYKTGFDWLKASFNDLETFMKIDDKSDQSWKKQVYNTLLTSPNTFATDTEFSNNYGSTGLIDGTSLFTSNNLHFGLALLDKVFEQHNNNLIEIDLFGKLEAFQQKLMAKLSISNKPNFDYVNENKEQENKEHAWAYAEVLEKGINPIKSTETPTIDDENYKTIVKEVFWEIFETSSGSKKYHTLYKVKDMEDTFVVLTEKGIKLVRNKKVDSVAKLKEYVINDLKTKLLNEKSKLPIPSYNAMSSISLNLSDNLNVVDVLIKNPKFIEFLKKQKNPLNPNNTAIKIETYNNSDIDRIKLAAETMKNGLAKSKVVNTMKDLEEWSKNQVKNKLNFDFIEVDKKIFIADSSGQQVANKKTADVEIFNYILELLKIKKD